MCDPLPHESISSLTIFDKFCPRCLWDRRFLQALFKKKLDVILRAFAAYINSQNYFDILYSKKAGYIYLVIDPVSAAGAEQLRTPEDMLDVLFNEIINDVINSPANKSHIPDTVTLTKWEETESRRQLTTILEQIESGGAEYLGYLDEYIKDYQERNAADDE